ncbi:MAG TPA: GLUG motif-containing protein [Rhizomicrobium sp.]|nr:GLUG motif-containing protein [Rhizomicrobium sp.]
MTRMRFHSSRRSRSEAIRCGLTAIASLLLATATAHATVTISNDATLNMSCTNGICAPTAKKAVLNVGDLENYLAAGNLEVTTTGSGVQAKDIEIDAAVTWTSASILTLDAHHSVVINRPVAVDGVAGLTVTTNDGGTGDTFSFGPKGNVSFLDLSSALVINGASYTLVTSLPSLAAAVNANPGGAYALANSYDASQDGIYGDSPIATELTGTVHGLGNIISHISIDSIPHKHRGEGDILGMFAMVGSTGTIENLRLNKISYRNKTKISVGGLVGENEGYIIGDQVAGAIISKGSAGGLAFANMPTGMIVSSSARVEVTAPNGLGGGLVADNSGTITRSHADGRVGGAGGVGGLVGSNEGTISQSYATGDAVLGGLVGSNQSDGTHGGTIENSYSTGTVRGIGGTGGLVGYNTYDAGTVIVSSYSTGVVQSGDGGFVCQTPDTYGNDYWNTTTSGATYGLCYEENVPGITGLTTQQLQSGLPAGFDPKIWAEKPKINNGFPYLINNRPEK